MSRLLFSMIALAFATQALAAPAPAPKRTLTAFSSEAELSALFRDWAEEYRRRMERERRSRGDAGQGMAAKEMASAPAALAAPQAAKSAAADESVTNVQHAGVDEGGIVKVHGEHLVILRRGRLFTVTIGDRSLKPVSQADAYGPGVDPRGAWYDEMLLWGNTVAVIGYSYARGGTEIGLFEISAAGALRHRSTHHLRSNDYYSSRNYASRLIGSKLVFYTPLALHPGHGALEYALPALRRWQPGAAPGEFKRIAPATRIYRTDEPLDPWRGLALHTVSVCDLARDELDCESTAVLGPRGRVFYVAPGAVYVWNVDAGIFRLPLDGSAPSALKAGGSPVDQFSFLEGEDGFLNVLLRGSGRGDGMWGAEHGGASQLALLRVPVASFSDGRDSAPASAYRPLPGVAGWRLQNRYVGGKLLYGAGESRSRLRFDQPNQLVAVDVAGRTGAHVLTLPHAVERIEALGAHAVVAGRDGRDLRLTSLRLGRLPEAVGSYLRPNAAQGETRSHGFFYKADDAAGGVIGLPIVGGDRGASLLYLRNRSLALSEMGTLDARAGGRNDACRASCVDWYGNARPLFLRGRVFALMGYEIVEGRVEADALREVRRVSFAPGLADLIAD
jgi:hypothetical protein